MPNAPETKLLLETAEAAALVGVTASALRSAARAGRIPTAARSRRVRLFAHEAVEAFRVARAVRLAAALRRAAEAAK